MGSCEEPSNCNQIFPSDQLLLPECLSEDALRQLLLHRGVLKENLPKERGGLTDLYNRLILPLDQRKYNRSTRIGEKLSRLQIVKLKKVETSGNIQNTGADIRRTTNIKTKNQPHPANDLSEEPLAKKFKSTITWP